MMVKRMVAFMSSMSVGLVLLALIGLACAIGSGFMPGTFARTIPFQLLLFCFFINMSLCALAQTSGFVRALRRSRRGVRRITRQTAVLVLHLGILFVLIGGSVYTYTGLNLDVEIDEGKSADISGLMPDEKPISMRLDSFRIHFNPDGSAAQYESQVAFIKGTEELLAGSVSVNHPLTYHRLKLYQQSYGYRVIAETADRRGRTVRAAVAEGDMIHVPGTARRVKIYKYVPDFDQNYGMNSRSLKPNNPRVIYSVYQDGKRIGIGLAQFGQKITVDQNAGVRFTRVQPFSVLRVKTDPGLPVAAAGGMMIMLGVCFALLIPRKIRTAIPAEE